jgi:hypothetical protein
MGRLDDIVARNKKTARRRRGGSLGLAFEALEDLEDRFGPQVDPSVRKHNLTALAIVLGLIFTVITAWVFL